MPSNLYAMFFRMKYINRWSLMHCSMNETLTQHSLETALIAHALAVIENKKLGGNVNEERCALVALFHDTPEILTGDLPTPVKHGSKAIEAAYSEIENEAKNLFIDMAPTYMKETVDGVLNEKDSKINELVKAADKISALIKCIDELKVGNPEFEDVMKSTKKSIKNLGCKAADIFIDEFLDGFKLTIDGLKNTN